MQLSKTLKSLVVIAACAAAATATAGTIPVVDTLLGSKNLPNSGDQTELDALNSYLSTNQQLSSLSKTDVSTSNLPSAVLDADGNVIEWKIDLGTASPGYFVLKFGTGGTTVTDDTYFFQNIGETNLLVFTNDQVNHLTGGACSTHVNNCNIERLSHYDIAGKADDGGGGVTGDVPEPASLALVGLGLAAFNARRRARAR